MKESTSDKISGLAKQAKGKVQSAAGKVTGSTRLKIKGAANQAVGKIQEKMGDAEKARGR